MALTPTNKPGGVLTGAGGIPNLAVPHTIWGAVPAVDQQMMQNAYARGGPVGLKSAVIGKPYANDVNQLIAPVAGAAQNAPGARPVSGGIKATGQMLAGTGPQGQDLVKPGTPTGTPQAIKVSNTANTTGAPTGSVTASSDVGQKPSPSPVPPTPPGTTPPPPSIPPSPPGSTTPPNPVPTTGPAGGGASGSVPNTGGTSTGAGSAPPSNPPRPTINFGDTFRQAIQGGQMTQQDMQALTAAMRNIPADGHSRMDYALQWFRDRGINPLMNTNSTTPPPPPPASDTGAVPGTTPVPGTSVTSDVLGNPIQVPPNPVYTPPELKPPVPVAPPPTPPQAQNTDQLPNIWSPF